MTEQELRAKVVSIAKSYLGCNERDGSHKKIIDLYNSHKPLARGYKVQYTDAWCATFVSAVSISAGLTDIIPTECSCTAMIELLKKLGSWQENDAYVPSPGDIIFYDWQDGTNYATTDNKGAPDHVGIVENVSGKTITVIDGNYSDSVKHRIMTVNGRYIRGYGVPNYSSKVTVTDIRVDSARYRLNSLAGTYKTTSDLHLRAGAGTAKTSLAIVPKGDKVQNYGYYSEIDGKKWLYVQYKGYTGFCSSAYLTKI